MQGVKRCLSQRETQQGLFLRILLDVPLSLERRALSSSHVRAFRRVGEEGRGGGGGLAFFCSFKLLQLKVRGVPSRHVSRLCDLSPVIMNSYLPNGGSLHQSLFQALGIQQ